MKETAYLGQKDRVFMRKGPRGKSANVVENRKARTSERTPEGPRTSVPRSQTSNSKSPKRPWTSVRRTRVPYRKGPRKEARTLEKA